MTTMYPGFRGGAKCPQIPVKKLKVPRVHKPIAIDEKSLTSFTKKKYDVTFMLNGQKRKQSVWAKDDAEAIAMIKELYPKASKPFRKNPRGAGIPIDPVQLDMMVEAYKCEHTLAFPDSKRQSNAIKGLIQSDLMEPVKENMYKLTEHGRKLLIEFLVEQEQYT